MKKTLIIYMVFTILLLSLSVNVYAASYKGTITGTGVRMRKGPGTNYGIVENVVLNQNQSYNMSENKLYTSQAGCQSGYWYKIDYSSSISGYVCSTYVSVSKADNSQSPADGCETDLKNKGFPSTYWAGLCSLKQAHSNWNFYPIITNIDWNVAVSNESSCGKSYIATTKAEYINNNCNNLYKKTWYPASSSAVAFYMDPRNFFSEKYIFQFEYLKYDQSISYNNAVHTLLSNNAFYTYHGSNLSTIISNVGRNNDISPLFIASRMNQELGSDTKLYNLYSGVYPGYEGYYNFYNIGVSDSCATTQGTTVCGLNYAKNNNWYGLENAINGGASFIAKSYINKGQFNTYLQKFNVKPNNSNSLYLNQYMTNVSGPSSESTSTYSSYSKLGLLNNSFAFYIPVYNNMDNSNYVDDGKKDEGNSQPSLSNTQIETIIVSSGFRNNGNYIENISPLTDVSYFKSKIESIGGKNSVVVYNANDNIVDTGYIGTGYKVLIKNNSSSKYYTAIVNGDTSGDGKITALDLLQVQKNILGSYNLSGVYFNAGDTNNDGKITALDLLQIQKHILGSYVIVQ